MTEETTATEVDTTETDTTEAPAPVMPSLGLNDLALMANVIQVTADRGAIKANEMTAVGALYNKLVSFVQANVPAPSPEISEQDIEDNGADEDTEEE
jgi:hypothetical protein